MLAALVRGIRLVAKRPARLVFCTAAGCAFAWSPGWADEPPAKLDAVVSRAAAWVGAFEREFAALVAEEAYEQRELGGTQTLRRLRSDIMLLRMPGQVGWLQFRDVLEVDRRPVGDRRERLQKLFLDTPDTALHDAARLTRESSRYNLGQVIRTINVPTFALICLDQAYLARFSFEHAGQEVVDGVTTDRLRFVERGGRTIVRTLRGQNVRLEGMLWVDVSGRVIRTLVKTAGTPDPDQRRWPTFGTTMMWVLTMFGEEPDSGFWVPTEMREWAQATNGAAVSGAAVYSHIRRFRVLTDESFQVKDR